MSGDNYKRLAAIPKLTEYPNKKTIDILINLLDDKKNDIRLASIETLWELHNKDAIKPLMMAHHKETVGFNRIMISLCLLSLGETSTFNNLFDDIAENSVSNDDWDMTDLVYSGLSKELKEKAIPYLENGLRHSDHHVRWISLRAIDELVQNKLEILEKYMFLNEDPYLELRKLYRELAHFSKKEGEIKNY
ncbi:MAG: HEAT repeat domain-containing protein [Desulfobacteraceae bacterium]|nr:HEAT repeat domain-containing protein [Desulfobacteraceae bacterium]